MKGQQSNFIILNRRFLLLLVIYFICRLLFFIFNYEFYSSINVIAIVKSFFYGIRYDITAIVIGNVFFISLHLLPFSFFYNKLYQKILKILFFTINIPFLLLNCIDIGLFRFTGKRSGAEIFSIMSFGHDFVNTVPKMIIDFWYLLLFFFGFVYLINRYYPRMSNVNNGNNLNGSKYVNSIGGKIILFLIFFGLTFIGFRGGIQYKPLNILSASKYGTGNTTSLVLNTSFTVIKTFGKQRLEEINWMSDTEAKKISPVIMQPNSASQFKQKNVVLIILESFGKEYIGSLNKYKGYTPFLDSLINQSLVFTNAYANGKRSIEGIPAIISGIPALMNEPFVTSVYSGNTITSLPSLLKQKGYSSTFFHGGTNGTMNFDNYCKLAGFEHYFGRNEYNNDDDFDGNWGIYDEPFLKRTVKEIDKMKPPFLAAIFTLSSHHPYQVPEKYKNQIPEGTLPIHQSIGYADIALREFFKEASQAPWFKNTLFVITADHTALTEYPFYRSQVGLFSVPLIFYSISDSLLNGRENYTTQHIDILPSIMDYLGYDQPFFAFGKSVFNKSERGFAIECLDETYQLISGDYAFAMDLTEKKSLYKFAADSTLKYNLAGKRPAIEKDMEAKLKSVVQNYNKALINNQMK